PQVLGRVPKLPVRDGVSWLPGRRQRPGVWAAGGGEWSPGRGDGVLAVAGCNRLDDRTGERSRKRVLPEDRYGSNRRDGSFLRRHTGTRRLQGSASDDHDDLQQRGFSGAPSRPPKRCGIAGWRTARGRTIGNGGNDQGQAARAARTG